MIYDKRSVLSGYINNLLASGRVVFTADEAEQALGINHGAFLDAVERLQRRHAVLTPRQGFYVVVPPHYAAWQAPPPEWYIDAMMRSEGVLYYVGLLKAAELHGATHQAVMEFQVVSGKRWLPIRAGRNRLVFYYRKELAAVQPGVEARKTDTGLMQVSSPALTALDLLRYPQACGGIDHVALVLSELAQKIEPGQLGMLALGIEKPVVQRLGFLLDWLGQAPVADAMYAALLARGNLRWVELEPSEARDPIFAREPQENNARWRVVVRRLPVLDE